MLKTDESAFFDAVLFAATGERTTYRLHFLSGGYGNNVAQLETLQRSYCLKWNENLPEEAFASQADDLRRLHNQGLSVPLCLHTGRLDGKAYILLEYVGFYLPHANFWEAAGQALARLHQYTCTHFGWERENWLHTLPLNNAPSYQWPHFFCEQRLRPLLGKAFYDGKLPKEYLRKLDALQVKLPSLLPNEAPHLLHGNFYKENVLADKDGLPTWLSPVPFYGHRELEIAQARFFSDIPEEFFEAYEEVFPLAQDFEQRRQLYNLYILAQYLNRFGTSYLSGIDKIFRRFLGYS